MTATKPAHPCRKLIDDGNETAAAVLMELTRTPATVYNLSFLFRWVQPCHVADAAETLRRYGYATRTQTADGYAAYSVSQKAIDESAASV